MCGIVGIIGQKSDTRDQALKAMAGAIRHRGPDDQGFLYDERVALAMNRLSIIDIAGSKQPIFSESGDHAIFFNGEIYNYKELRKELVSGGYHFQTEGDTEVVLALYLTEGKGMLSRLRGMFAFCIYDMKGSELFIARDQFGIKPLYYLAPEGKILAYASEIKALLHHPEYAPEVNDEAVFNYLSYQYNPFVETMFRGIFRLAPASAMTVSLPDGVFSTKTYWKYSIEPDESMRENEAEEKLASIIEDSVTHHMIADVPVASFLSGGIDSGIIATSIQKKLKGQSLSTFTVGFKGWSEAKEAREVADAIKSNHEEVIVSEDEYFSVLPKVVWHMDEPIADPSAVALYFVARAAGKKVKVVLSGEGADELFGGYNVYLEPYARRKTASLLKPFAPTLHSLLAKSPHFYGKNFLKRATMPLQDRYIGNATVFSFAEAKKMWRGGDSERFSLSSLYKEAGNISESSTMQHIDIHTWLPGDILAKADKMTMAHSLELRVPFLDMEVAAFARTIPDRLKFRPPVTKYLLRESAKGFIPESTRQRKKLGFPTPVGSWLTPRRQDIYNRILNNPYIQEKLNVSYIRELISEHTSGKHNHGRKLFLLLMLALWHEVFIERKGNLL